MPSGRWCVTFVVTWNPNPHCGAGYRPNSNVLTSSSSAGLGSRASPDGPVSQVGLELEAHCCDQADPARPGKWAGTDRGDRRRARPARQRHHRPNRAAPSSSPVHHFDTAAAIAGWRPGLGYRAGVRRGWFSLVLLGTDPLATGGWAG